MKKKKSSKTQEELEQEYAKYVDDICNIILNTTFDILEEEADTKGKDVIYTLLVNMLKRYVATMVYMSLTQPMQETNTEESYATIKNFIQEAVADGFEAAAKEFSGKDTGYYCQIKVIGEPVNKEEI